MLPNTPTDFPASTAYCQVRLDLIDATSCSSTVAPWTLRSTPVCTVTQVTHGSMWGARSTLSGEAEAPSARRRAKFGSFPFWIIGSMIVQLISLNSRRRTLRGPSTFTMNPLDVAVDGWTTIEHSYHLPLSLASQNSAFACVFGAFLARFRP